MAYAVEIVIGLMMIATCGYCIALNRKLKTLRDGQAALAATIEQFDAATRRAEENLNAIQGAGATLNRDIAAAAARANGMIDELSVMVHAGDNVAARIEAAVKDVRIQNEEERRLAS